MFMTARWLTATGFELAWHGMACTTHAAVRAWYIMLVSHNLCLHIGPRHTYNNMDHDEVMRLRHEKIVKYREAW